MMTIDDHAERLLTALPMPCYRGSTAWVRARQLVAAALREAEARGAAREKCLRMARSSSRLTAPFKVIDLRDPPGGEG